MIVPLIIIGLGAFCALVYYCATYALPLMIGVGIGTLAYELGADVIGSIVIGFITGILTLAAAQLIFSATRSVLIRLLLAAAFGLTAAFAGYQFGLSLFELSELRGFWMHAFSAVGGIAAGISAVKRLANPDGPHAPDVTA